MTLPAQDIVERLPIEKQIEYALFLAAGQDDPHSVTITELCDSLSRLTADNEALRKDNARLSEEKEALAFGMRNGQSLSEDAIHAIRDLLNEAGVPLAAFIDDHVGNAIAQRNQERARVSALSAEVERQADQINAAREFVKRHPALTLIDLAEFEAFLKLPAAYDAALLRAMQKEER